MATIKNNEIILFPNPHDLFHAAAKDFENRAISAIQLKGIFSVVLSGGKTPEAFFDVLSNDEHYKKSIPWDKIQFFFGDERYVSSDDTNNNYHMAYEHLFSKVPINPKNIYSIPTHFDDPKDAAIAYESTLRKFFHIDANQFPAFDLLYLGLGDNAHTASIMPFTTKSLSDKKNQLVASLFVPDLNMYRITLTPNAINNSKTIIFLVTGENKATAVSEVLAGPSDPDRYPAQLIHCVNEKTLWYLDQAAAKKLKRKAIFLDSDGVLNTAIMKDGKPAAPTTLAELEIPTEVKPSLEKMKAAGYLLICVTNKPDIERGLMTQAAVDAIFNKMRSELPLDDVFICYKENSACYKPNPGLLFDAAEKYEIDLTNSYMIGDRWRDVAAGQNAGCKTIWIDRGYTEKKPNPPADYTVHSLAEATQAILKVKK